MMEGEGWVDAEEGWWLGQTVVEGRLRKGPLVVEVNAGRPNVASTDGDGRDTKDTQGRPASRSEFFGEC